MIIIYSRWGWLMKPAVYEAEAKKCEANHGKTDIK